MKFSEMPYRRVTYEEIEAGYAELFAALEAVGCEADCRAVLESRYALQGRMTPMDICYVRHGMDVNDGFYAAEQRYYDEIEPIVWDLSNRFDRLLMESPQ